MYVYPSVCTFTRVTFTRVYVRLPEYMYMFIHLIKGTGSPGGPREGGRPDSPLRSVLNKFHNYVYPDVCTFTRLYVRLPEYIHVYPDVYAFTRVYVRLPESMYVYPSIFTFTRIENKVDFGYFLGQG